MKALNVDSSHKSLVPGQKEPVLNPPFSVHRTTEMLDLYSYKLNGYFEANRTVHL